jgi:hypothetical protein
VKEYLKPSAYKPSEPAVSPVAVSAVSGVVGDGVPFEE